VGQYPRQRGILCRNFANEFINVVRREQTAGENELGGILRGWFGPDAGQPGTRFQVLFETVGDSLKMQPVGIESKTAPAETWRHYMIESSGSVAKMVRKCFAREQAT